MLIRDHLDTTGEARRGDGDDVTAETGEREVTIGLRPHESDQDLANCRLSKLWLALISCGLTVKGGLNPRKTGQEGTCADQGLQDEVFGSSFMGTGLF